MRDDHSAGFAHGSRNGFPVVRAEGAQVNQFYADAMLALNLLRRLQSPRNQRAVRNHGEVTALLDDFGFPERDNIIRAGVRRAAKGLTIEALVLEKKNGIIAANCRTQKPVSVLGVGGKADAQAGDMSKDALTALRVIDGSSREVSANGHTDHRRAGKVSVRAPADQGQLIAELVHRRPDVIKELYFHHRFQPARGHAYGASHNVGFGQGRVENTVSAKLHLQPRRQLEHATLAFDLLLFQIFFAAAIGNVFAKDHNAVVATHFIFQADVDQFGHSLVPAVRLRR